ncbi:MAG: hypothetical protein ACT4OM_11810 [Actinomycetota bacterium]
MSVPKSKAGIVKALLRNPASRKILMDTAKKAAGAASVAAAKAGQARAARSSRTGDGAPPAPAPAPSAKPSNESRFPFPLPLPGNVEAMVNSIAKPVVEKLAASGAGRAVLSAVNSITEDALKRGKVPAAAQPRAQSDASQAAPAKPKPKPEPEPVHFTPLSPPAPSAPVESLKWPPPKPSNLP